MHPVLKDIRKEALKHLQPLKNSTSSDHGSLLDTYGAFHSVRNLPKKRLFDHSPVLLKVYYLCAFVEAVTIFTVGEIEMYATLTHAD